MMTACIYHEMCFEMLKLRDMLDEMNIHWIDDSDPLTTENINCRKYRTHIYYKGDRYSVVYGYGTYGGWGRFPGAEDPQRLELMINHEKPTGWHTAEDIISIMKERQTEI